MELIWFQYVVGYDKQEQRTLATTLHHQVFDYGRSVSSLFATIKNYLTGNGLIVSIGGLALLLGAFIFFFGKRFWLWLHRGSADTLEDGRTYSSVQFYERLVSLMEQRGLLRDQHLTPLEFAGTLKSHEALLITRAYNRVRYGREKLSAIERREVEKALFALEATKDPPNNN